MKDLFKNYHRQKVLSHLGLLAISGVLAVSVNMFVLGGATGDSLKANLKEIQTSTVAEDISVQHTQGSIKIVNNKQMDGVTQFSISFAYNQDLLSFGDVINTNPGVNVSKIETSPGFSSFIVVMDSPIAYGEGTNILEINYTRGSSETIHLNPINMNFIDSSENTYSLTSSSLIF